MMMGGVQSSPSPLSFICIVLFYKRQKSESSGGGGIRQEWAFEQTENKHAHEIQIHPIRFVRNNEC